MKLLLIASFLLNSFTFVFPSHSLGQRGRNSMITQWVIPKISYFELAASYWVGFSLVSSSLEAFSILLYHFYQFTCSMSKIIVSSSWILNNSWFQLFIELGSTTYFLFQIIPFLFCSDSLKWGLSVPSLWRAKKLLKIMPASLDTTTYTFYCSMKAP